MPSIRGHRFLARVTLAPRAVEMLTSATKPLLVSKFTHAELRLLDRKYVSFKGVANFELIIFQNSVLRLTSRERKNFDESTKDDVPLRNFRK